MNILVFSPVHTHPQNEGNCKRIYTFTKYLQSQGHTIHFVYYTQSWHTETSLEQMTDTWDTLTVIEKTAYCEESDTGYPLDAWYEDTIHHTVKKVIDTFDIDAVVVNYIMQSKLLEYVPDHILKIIDTHDKFADRHLLFQGTDMPYTWYSVSKEDETKALRRADIVLAIQEEEAAYFRSITDTEVRTVSHLESSRFLRKTCHTLATIGFIGSYNTFNEYAMKQFIPAFLAHPVSKKVKLLLAGSICQSIQTEHPSIIKLGFVEDPQTFYAQADLVINPLLNGTGLKIKTIEALSYGVPLISTNVGFEGLGSSETCHRLSTISKMLECIDDLYHTPQMLSVLRDKSMALFETYEKKTREEIDALFCEDTFKTHQKRLQPATNTKEQTLISLYREYQRYILDQKEKEEAYHKHCVALSETLDKTRHRMDTLSHSIRQLAEISFHKAPLQKYKAYKKMLQTFFSQKEYVPEQMVYHNQNKDSKKK